MNSSPRIEGAEKINKGETPSQGRKATPRRQTKNARRLLAQAIFVSLLIVSAFTNASAQNCKGLTPAGNGQDDAAAINDCLQRKGLAKLAAGTFLLYSPIVFPRTSLDAPVSGARLIGKGKDATKLVLQSECNKRWPLLEAQTPGQYQPAIQIVKSPEALVTRLELDLTNLRQDCGSYGNYMISVSKSPKTQVSEVRIKGSQYGLSGATYTTGGANSGGIIVVNADDSIITGNEIKDLGFTFENGSLSAGNSGISIASSANAQVINNKIERVAFGIVVSNGSTREGYYGDSSGTVVTGNTVIGAANINCQNCSQGRGIKLQACGDGSELPLNRLTISNNDVKEFGGHLSTIGGSGLDLVCGVQNSTFENNRFAGASTAEFGLQIRGSFLSPPSPSYHNKFSGNLFSSGRGQVNCGLACVDVNFTYDGADQIGIRRNGANKMGNNLVGSFFAETDRGCDDYSHPYFLYLDGRDFVRQGERVLLTALGVRPNSQVTFKFKRAEDGTEVLTYKSASVNRYCIMNQEYISIEAAKFAAGDYKIFAEYKDGNSDAVITNDEIGVIKVKPAKGQ
jgi:hypothetical protein